MRCRYPLSPTWAPPALSSARTCSRMTAFGGTSNCHASVRGAAGRQSHCPGAVPPPSIHGNGPAERRSTGGASQRISSPDGRPAAQNRTGFDRVRRLGNQGNDHVIVSIDSVGFSAKWRHLSPEATAWQRIAPDDHRRASRGRWPAPAARDPRRPPRLAARPHRGRPSRQ